MALQLTYPAVSNKYDFYKLVDWLTVSISSMQQIIALCCYCKIVLNVDFSNERQERKFFE